MKEPKAMSTEDFLKDMRAAAMDAELHGTGVYEVRYDDAVQALSIALESIYKRLPWYVRLWLWFKKALAL